MNLFDCFLDDYILEKSTEGLTELDIRAQVEVSYKYKINLFLEECFLELNEEIYT